MEILKLRRDSQKHNELWLLAKGAEKNANKSWKQLRLNDASNKCCVRKWCQVQVLIKIYAKIYWERVFPVTVFRNLANCFKLKSWHHFKTFPKRILMNFFMRNFFTKVWGNVMKLIYFRERSCEAQKFARYIIIRELIGKTLKKRCRKM